jgi:uncharacterized protein YhaN
MRFERLDILRYGALTDRSLAFRADAKLHIVYGPNEAGKSSALSAISDLLFGFTKVGDKSFFHRPNMLRVGARLSAKGGEALEFRRKNGQKNTILKDQEDEEALSDDALAPFLGSLTREIFERAFGLNSHSLNSGGKEMLKSGGEIGSLLFSAASGLTGLSEMRKTLEAEADVIYAPRRSKDRLFYQVLDTHEEARKAERLQELRAGDWTALVKEERQIESDLQAVSSERQEKKRALEHLRLLQRLDPIIREIDRERAQLSDFEALAGLPADFEAELALLLDRLRDNEAALRRSEADKAKFSDDLRAIHVNDPLLSASAAIMAAHSGIGAYVNARNDIGRVRAEVEDFDQRLAQAARRLGLSGVADIESGQPPDADLARLRTLVEEGGKLDRGLRDVRERIEEEHDTLRRMEESGPDRRLLDPKPWTEQLAALQPELADLQRAETLQVRLSRAESDLSAAMARLVPAVTDLRALLALPLPEAGTLAEHRRRIEEARLEAKAATAKVTALEEEAAETAHQLAALEGTGRIVSREDLAASRAERDGLLEDLRTTPQPSGFDRLAGAIAGADALADTALSDAERVSRHAQLLLRQRELEQGLTAATKQAKEADITLSDELTDYEDGFRTAGIRPVAPERMIDWRRGVDELFRQLRESDALRDELEALKLKEDRVRPALLSLADATGFAAAALPTTAIARGLERRLTEIAQAWVESRAGETKRAMAEQALARLEERERGLLDEISRWQSGFASALTAVGLPEDAEPPMALAALEAWRTVPETLFERQNRERRVRGMMRDMEAFEAASAKAVAAVAPDLAGVPAEVAASLLHERLMAETAENKHRAALSAELERVGLTITRLAAEQADLTQEATRLAARLQKTQEDLPQVLDDLRRRQHLERELRNCRDRFAEHAGGASEEEIRGALTGFDRIAAGLEIDRLTSGEDRLIERMNALGILQAENERRRRDLETGIGAERAVFQKLAAEEEAKELARRWVVLKLAASLLSSSMEAYRERQADPVMKRAGELFSGLTGGRFARLLQVYDERDDLQLAVERQTGEQVPLLGLSEGTGDQLYLALRLAFLEDYCRRNEPAPLVLDDIFQTFDDDRTAAGLRTLADAGETHQTLLFTHQTSVVETAKRELGDGVDVVRL